MRLPKPVTWTHVDWAEYRRYLEKKYPKEWAKYYNPLWRWFCDNGDFHNGCYVDIEKGDMGYEADHPAVWLSNRLFEDYPEVADRYETIKLWVWW